MFYEANTKLKRIFIFFFRFRMIFLQRFLNVFMTVSMLSTPTPVLLQGSKHEDSSSRNMLTKYHRIK